MAELVMRKRAAKHAGELGLFIDAEVFEDDFKSIKMDTAVEIKATQSRSLPQMRMAWALAAKIAGSGALGDADRRDAMDYLLLKARHVRYITNKHANGEETIPVVKSIRFAAMDQTEFQRLMNRMVHIVVTEIIPGLDEGALRSEIEAMVADPAKPIEPEKPKQERKSTARRRPPLEPVSVIPDDDDPGSMPETSAPIPAERKEVHATTSEDSQEVSETVLASNIDPGTPVQFSLQPFYDGKFNVADWTEWTKAWLMAALIDMSVTDQDVITRWNNERALRNECGVTAEDRAPMFDLYTRTIDRIRNRRKT